MKGVIPLYEEEAQTGMEPDVIVLEDDDGNELKLEVREYFFYNGDEYAILSEYNEATDQETDAEGDEDNTDVDCYVMKITAFTDENGEEMETFEMIEDAALEKRVMEIAQNRMNAEDELEDE